MSKQLRAVLVSNTVQIDTARIPAHVSLNIGQVALQAIQRAYRDPAIQAEYQQWKAERAARAARGGGYE